MNSKIVASKNTGMYYQGFTAELEKDSPLAFSDFKTLVGHIMGGIDTLDTMNPYNTYGIEENYIDIDAVTASDYEQTITLEINFSIAEELKTTYIFEDTITDYADIETAILGDIMDIVGASTHADIPPIIINHVNAKITVAEVTPDSGDGE